MPAPSSGIQGLTFLFGGLLGGAPPVTPTQAWINIGGTWKQATVWLNISGVWKTVTSYVKVGTWR
jgi:hypothetical protein